MDFDQQVTSWTDSWKQTKYLMRVFVLFALCFGNVAIGYWVGIAYYGVEYAITPQPSSVDKATEKVLEEKYRLDIKYPTRDDPGLSASNLGRIIGLVLFFALLCMIVALIGSALKWGATPFIMALLSFFPAYGLTHITLYSRFISNSYPQTSGFDILPYIMIIIIVFFFVLAWRKSWKTAFLLLSIIGVLSGILSTSEETFNASVLTVVGSMLLFAIPKILHPTSISMTNIAGVSNVKNTRYTPAKPLPFQRG